MIQRQQLNHARRVRRQTFGPLWLVQSSAISLTSSSATSLYVVRPFFSTFCSTLTANCRSPLPGARRFEISLELQFKISLKFEF